MPGDDLTQVLVDGPPQQELVTQPARAPPVAQCQMGQGPHPESDLTRFRNVHRQRLLGLPLMGASRRGSIRAQLLDRARQDPRVAGAALTGSAASGTEDDWSDIDLFLGVAGVEPSEVLDDFSAFLYGELGALHHFNLTSGPAVYRAFFLHVSCTASSRWTSVWLGSKTSGHLAADHSASCSVILDPRARPSKWTSTISLDWSGTTSYTRAAASNGTDPGKRSTGSARSATTC